MEIFFTHSFGREQWNVMKIIQIVKQSKSSTFTITNKNHECYISNTRDI